MDTTALRSILDKNKTEYIQNAAMSRHTTFKIGGPADLLVLPENQEEFLSTVAACRETNTPFFIIGNGSNLLISDLGIDGAVIKTERINNISADGNLITCGAGVMLSALCRFAATRGLSGLEFAFGIPGSVGGAVYMNAGAYGGEMKDAVLSVDFLDEDGKIKTLSGEELSFGNRKSAFTNSGRVILSARFSLSPGDGEKITAAMDEFMSRRREKQPLDLPSAGSVFKRPKNNFAGALIEECALKGKRIGDAQVSEKHAGFIVNRGHATSEEVTALINEIVKTVKSRKGVLLEPEVIKKGR